MPKDTGPFAHDKQGRTPLFEAVETGDIERVRKIIFRLAGTGVCCQRLSLINTEDANGQTVIDAAKQAGFQDIADLLLSEKMRMEYFE